MFDATVEPNKQVPRLSPVYVMGDFWWLTFRNVRGIIGNMSKPLCVQEIYRLRGNGADLVDFDGNVVFEDRNQGWTMEGGNEIREDPPGKIAASAIAAKIRDRDRDLQNPSPSDTIEDVSRGRAAR